MRVVLIAFLLTRSCGFNYPTQSEPATVLIAGEVMSACRHLGIEAEVRFQSEQQFVNGVRYGLEDKNYPICMNAEVPNVVNVFPSCLGFDDWTHPARHECCHLALGHRGSPIPSESERIETEANECVKERF